MEAITNAPAKRIYWPFSPLNSTGELTRRCTLKTVYIMLDLKSKKGFQDSGDHYQEYAGAKPDRDLGRPVFPMISCSDPQGSDKTRYGANSIHQLHSRVVIATHHGIGLSQAIVAVGCLGIETALPHYKCCRKKENSVGSIHESSQLSAVI